MRYALPEHAYRRRAATRVGVIHCAATENNGRYPLTAMRHDHVEVNKWLDVAYHLYIDTAGVTWPGRPLWAEGAGVAGHNADTLHLCLEGGGAEQEVCNFTAAQWRTLRALVVLCTAVYPAIRWQGHRDFPGVTKWCPAFDVRTWIAREGL